ncbi:MAG: class I tRNA ligase family protein, partial [Candidatus Micrarchaeota archaeon]
IVAIKSFFWKEFADLYLEDVKYRIYQEDIFGKESKEAAQYVLREVLLKSLQLLSPFIVYTTEDLYHNLFKEEAAKHKSIHKTDFPKADKTMKLDGQTLKASSLFHTLISEIRKYKAGNQLALNTELARVKISLPENMESQVGRFEEEIKAVCKAKLLEFNFTKEEIPKVECFV